MSRVSSKQMSRKAVGVLAAGFTVAVLAALPAKADNIQVIVDQAKVMHIPRPADIVIIGNPAIADATIQDSQTLIITGHSFGTTNLILLDSEGKTIASELVSVGTQNDDIVTVYRRASRETFSCTPDCSPMLAVGDNSAAFDAVNAQIQSHSALSSAAAGGNP